MKKVHDLECERGVLCVLRNFSNNTSSLICYNIYCDDNNNNYNDADDDGNGSDGYGDTDDDDFNNDDDDDDECDSGEGGGCRSDGDSSNDDGWSIDMILSRNHVNAGYGGRGWESNMRRWKPKVTIRLMKGL